MNLFEFLVLNKLYSTSSGGSGCGCLFALIVCTCIIIFLSENFGIILISLLAIIVITIIVLTFTRLFSFNRWRSMLQKMQKVKEKQEFNLQPIKTLAEDFINKTITLNKPELNNDDYKMFYELVKENNIEVDNNYSTSIPYQVRSILYDAYVKKYNEFIEPHEIEIAEIQEKELQAEELRKTAHQREIFKTFSDTIKPYIISYIKTLLPKNGLPEEINKNFKEDEIAAFIYLLENNYQINIPIMENVKFDTLYFSENTLQHIRNAVTKYYTNNKQEQKMCFMDIILSYNYALEVYNLFEGKILDIKSTIEDLVQTYITLFNDDLLYIDLLLEYMQKHNIEIPKPKENETLGIDKAINIFENILRDNIITNPSYNYPNIYLEDVMDCSDSNWKYLYLLNLIVQELEQQNIKIKANNMMIDMLNASIKNDLEEK